MVPLDFEAVDVRDVGMVQRGENFGLTLEPCKPIGIGRHCRWQHLDRDLPLQVCVGGAIDLAHPSGPDGSGDFVRAKTGAGSQRSGRQVAES
jgi:hypothetical protein